MSEELQWFTYRHNPTTTALVAALCRSLQMMQKTNISVPKLKRVTWALIAGNGDIYETTAQIPLEL